MRYIYNDLIAIISGACLLFFACDSPKQIKPDDSRFTKMLLVDNLDEPMQFEILDDDRVLFVERKGKIKLYDPKDNKTKIIADLDVSVGYYSELGDQISPTGEDGLFGAILDPNFDSNRWIYVFYSPAGGKHRSIVSRFEWKQDSLDMNSEIVLLEIPNQRLSCCHLGGGLLFDSDGNLFITTGDNTANDPRGYNPIDARAERSNFDAQRSSSNTNDLRGKILRIRPESDGTYSIPEGNLFPKGTLNTRPEIYTMGNRNPWRLSLDSKTGWLFWGEVGPNGVLDSTGFGPRSYDEFNIAKKAGNFGWPYFIGPNLNYWNFDYLTNTTGEAFNSKSPLNLSANNTGIKDLPKPEAALIWYPQTKSDEFPLMGSGSNSAAGGPIYRNNDFKNASRAFPLYYEGKWFITDWTRGWIMVVTLDVNGNFESMEQFLPKLKLNGPIDMKFGPNGDLYVLEYGRGPYRLNPEASLSRIEYNSGNRSPIVKISSDKLAGADPLTINLSSSGTIDLDNDDLKFEWIIELNDREIQTFFDANSQITLKEPGTYLVNLKVSDSQGAEANDSIEIVVGNDSPEVGFDLGNKNKSFYFYGDTLLYNVEVLDNEDGSLKNNEIKADQVSVNIEYSSYEEEGLNDLLVQLKQFDAMIPLQSVVATNVMNKSDCISCHIENENLIGPSYIEISKRYTIGERRYLIDKILKGGSGAWNSKMAMPAHPEINELQAGLLVDYILGLKSKDIVKHFANSDAYIIPNPNDKIFDNKKIFGSLSHVKLIFRASYLDNGSSNAPQLIGSDIVVLRNPLIPIINFDVFSEVEINHQIFVSRSSVIPKKSGSFIALKQIDLAGINEVKLDLSILSESKEINFGIIEIRLNSSDGKLIGDLRLERNGNNSLLKNNNIKILNIEGFHDLYVVFKKSTDLSKISNIELRSLHFIK
ncbi:PQQ-dependent sugar dehydrogenase [Algoriphagus antarcticus]|uniref:Cytochrome c n=1 Tax=Algoriphagus antarcticus TaxID=238540 RepID=A0A3E0E814_9BACT|nr:PQQ-dependent sugar dehydrogenase [Algoriphagus antarcticus]REG94382.1 cytochrome c [Algoriphagus antarcticus]